MTEQSRSAQRQQAYLLKITLQDVRPPIWRRVQVPSDITLGGLHDVIQTAMGWTDTHLHDYEIDGVRYGVPDPDEADDDLRPEHRTGLSDVAGVGSRLLYTYDFGDDWRHVVEVEKSEAVEPDVGLPRCLTGRLACPPEDVGGPWGYAEFLAAYRDSSHTEHGSVREWAGSVFDPDAFDADEVTQALRGGR